MKEYSQRAMKVTTGKSRALGPSHTDLSLNITSVLDDACDEFPTLLDVCSPGVCLARTVG